MIRSVSFEKTTYAPPPHRFEAGTPPIVEAIGLGAAIDYVSAIGMERIAAHEHALLNRATQRLSAIDGLTIYGTQAGQGRAILSFTLDSGPCPRRRHHRRPGRRGDPGSAITAPCP